MYLVINEDQCFKTKTLQGAINFLDFTGCCGDFGGLEEDMQEDDAWYNDGERVGIEKRDGRELRDVEWAWTGD